MLIADVLAPRAVGLAAAWAIATAAIGAAATALGPWYRALRKPPWQPPDWLFGPAWSLIFLCAALAGALAWSADGATEATRRQLLGVYVVNGGLNVLWSVLFFRLRRPDWALLDIPPLWLSIVAMLVTVREGSASGALLLVPYLAWVTFAGVLNLAIVRRNQPFGNR